MSIEFLQYWGTVLGAILGLITLGSWLRKGFTTSVRKVVAQPISEVKSELHGLKERFDSHETKMDSRVDAITREMRRRRR